MKNKLSEFDKNSKHFLLGDHFINSPDLFSWLFSDIVLRKLMISIKLFGSCIVCFHLLLTRGGALRDDT